MLRGARLVTASETEEGRAWAESRIKALTGGDPITARFMRKDFFTYQPAFKLFIVGNHLPTLQNVDEAAKRRFNIVGFNNKLIKPDPDLEQKLKGEWPSILRWMIDGCLDWQANGLLRPRSVLEATKDYFEGQDTFSQWLDEECNLQPGNEWHNAYSGELFSAWMTYAKAAGEPAGTQKAFSQMLKQKGCVAKKGFRGARRFEGISLKQDRGT